MQLGQNPEPFTQSCPCPVTPLSNGICLAFGMLQQSPFCTTSGHCSRRSPWQRAILFSATTPLPNRTLTTLKSAVATHILFYKYSASYKLCRMSKEVGRNERIAIIHWNIRQAKKKKNNSVSITKEGGKAKERQCEGNTTFPLYSSFGFFNEDLNCSDYTEWNK